MIFLFYFILYFYFTSAAIYTCPDYKALNKPKQTSKEKTGPTCNSVMINPKKVINRYKQDIENYVQPKPFGSICLRCSMCLAIAEEFDIIFKEFLEEKKEQKQTEIVEILKKNINSLCSQGFKNYDLRKVKQYQIVTDKVSCSTHVKTKMDGKWTEKLREICKNFSGYMDVQYLLNNYLKGIDDTAQYLCNSNGIFRDCLSLDFQNTSINPDQKNKDLC